MLSISKVISALSLSAIMTLTSLGSATAMPLPNLSGPQVSNVEQVQYRRHHRDRRHYRHHRHDRHYGRRHHRHHHGSNAGAIIGGLAAGAIIGGAIASSPRRSYAGSSHQQWCANRYRTYRASDNTYVPRAGVRAYCRSPY
jgi:ABC-type Zn2+ transport system substrate-binding protein/surface adhesin